MIPIIDIGKIPLDEIKNLCEEAKDDPELFLALSGLAAKHSKKMTDLIYPLLGLNGGNNLFLTYGMLCRIQERGKLD